MAALETLLVELVCGDDRRAEAAAVELGEHGTAALPALKDLLESPDLDRRWWAVRALAEIKAPEAGQMLLEALEDPEPEVQHCAALALRRRPDPQALPKLAALLEGDDRLLASLAGDALTAQGEAAVPELIHILKAGSHAARLEAVRALADLRDPRAIPALFDVLDETAVLDFWAGEGLERMGIGMMFFKA